MAVWKWEAVDEKRGVHRGIWEEADENLILSRLWKEKLYPVHIRRMIFGWLWIRRGAWNRKLYWSRTARKIGTLLQTGVSLLIILEIMADKEVYPARKRLWKKVSAVVQTGNDFSAGLKGFYPSPGKFLELMMMTGEKTGTLAACLLEAAGELEEEYFFEKRIKTAMFYPVLLLITAVTVVYILSILVLPMYENLFLGLNADLPLISRLLFKVGSNLPWIIGLAGVTAAGFQWLKKRRFWGLPGMGKIQKLRSVMQFCSTLHRFMDAGLPLLESLSLLEQIVKEDQLAKLVRELKFAVSEGKRISPVLEANGYFPAEAAALLGVAEESGKLSEMLAHVAEMNKRELQENLESYSRFVEPLLILGMAGLVGIVAIGVLMPIFDMSMHIQ
ncbi:MAG: type II secretion system F family protein [Peptococcaceae bacterium]|nr:type II secretion system F family protein [Peptococcaceae bacterium]